MNDILIINGKEYRIEGKKEFRSPDGEPVILHITGDVIDEVIKKGHAKLGPLYIVPVLRKKEVLA